MLFLLSYFHMFLINSYFKKSLRIVKYSVKGYYFLITPIALGWTSVQITKIDSNNCSLVNQ